MAKKRLLLVVGAGASIDFGMPKVGAVGDIINAEVQKWYPLAARPDSNLYKHIEGLIRRHWRRHVPDHLRRDPNFEDVLYTIFALAAAYPALADTSALGAVIKPKKFPDFNFGGQSKTVNRHELHNLGSAAVDALLSNFRERCRVSEGENIAEFARLQSFIGSMQTEFDIAVVTVNYDNIMYRALSGIETGFDPTNRQFDEKRIYERPEWSCMLHLHGSVHFDMQEMHEIFWQPDINATFFQNASDRSTNANPEGVEFPTSAIVVGYGKTTQILRRPFRTYYSELDRLVSGCDAALFAGYGFGDPHLNIAFDRFRDARQRPVVIIDKAKKGTMTLGGDVNSRLATAAINNLNTDLASMCWLGHTGPGMVDDLLAAKEFEVSSNPKTSLSVWYNGLLEACNNPAKVIEQLLRPTARWATR
jgi:hypothetical protein